MVNANGDTRPVHAHAVPTRSFVPFIPVRRTDEAEPAQPEWNHRMPDDAKEGAAHGVRANVVCPGFARTSLADRQIPEQAKELGITEEEVVKNVMLEETVDGEIGPWRRSAPKSHTGAAPPPPAAGPPAQPSSTLSGLCRSETKLRDAGSGAPPRHVSVPDTEDFGTRER
jgi:hypothetical protein